MWWGWKTTKRLDEVEKEGAASTPTKHATSAVKRLKDFVREEKLKESIETLPAKVLNDYLRYFYSELHREDASPQ